MAIIQNRLSTVPVPANYTPPEDRTRPTLNDDYEAGPIAITDTSGGMFYQNWTLDYVNGIDITLIPETVGTSAVILSVPDCTQISFCFDQNARPNIVYVVGTSVFLYWYDTDAAQFVTTEYPNHKSAMLSLDDKRAMQIGANDILFWYTRQVGLTYNLYHRRQRDRFLVEFLMAEDVYPYVYKAGMHVELRGQIELARTVASTVPPTIPPGPPLPQENLDFELGDVYWAKTGSFTITGSDPYEGSWSANLNTSVDDHLINEVFTLVLPESPAYVSCLVKGNSATTIKLGFKFYNEAKALVDTQVAVRAVTTDWTLISFETTVPLNAVYLKIYVESDNTVGPVTIDNFSFYGVDLANAFTVELDFPEFMQVELASPALFEVEV